MKRFSALLMLLSALVLSGCETLYQNSRHADSKRQEAVRIEMARQQQLRNLEVLKARNDANDLHLQQIDTRIDRLESSLHNISGTKNDIADLRREIDAIRSERETLKREVVDQLSREMAHLLAKQAASAPRGGSRSSQQSGYEHKVQTGQTLSEIAAAYNVSVSEIKRANDLKSDLIRVGQVLFVPD